ncbi:MAG: hypothetical protein IIC89_07110, partial [Chloroflexi bacterium]|nr:hypothetical protein [Chloroflexota bacterium]
MDDLQGESPEGKDFVGEVNSLLERAGPRRRDAQQASRLPRLELGATIIEMQLDFELMGATDEGAIEAQKRAETPSIRMDELKDFLVNNGFDPKDIDSQQLAALALNMPDTGIDQAYADEVLNVFPVLQQQKLNADFAAQKPEDRQAQIGGALGFGTQDGPTFGTQRGGITFQTPFDTARQEALASSQ